MTPPAASAPAAQADDQGATEASSGVQPDLPAPTPAPAAPGAPVAKCGAASPRFSGTLCGPSNVPCVLAAHEVVSAEPVFLAPGTTAIAVDEAGRPTIMYGTEDGGYHGHVATRPDAGRWSLEPTPFDLKTVSLAQAGDALHALVFDGVGSVFHVERGAGGWSAPDFATQADYGGSERLAVDDAGCVYAGFADPSAREQLATRRGAAWDLSAVGGAMARGGSPTVALAPGGEPHMVAWVPDPSGGLMLAWSTPSTTPESIGPMHVAGFLQPRLGVTGAGAGQPHVLFVDPGRRFAARAARVRDARRRRLGAADPRRRSPRHDLRLAAPLARGHLRQRRPHACAGGGPHQW